MPVPELACLPTPPLSFSPAFLQPSSPSSRMPAYADSHPVPPSPYAQAGGPVHLLLNGPNEDLVHQSAGMEIDWQTPTQLNPSNSRRLEALGWAAADWSVQGLPVSPCAPSHLVEVGVDGEIKDS